MLIMKGNQEIESSSTLHTRQGSLSIVVPAFNEADGLREFHRRLAIVMNSLNRKWEVLYVNDGSTDATFEIIQKLSTSCPQVGFLNLSRNFGKEVAMTAGLEFSSGDAVVVIDADLQDPPEVIADLVDIWVQGFDNVYAKRTCRKGEGWIKKVTAALYYRVIRKMTQIDIPIDTGDFRLLSRRAVDALLQLRERHRFMKGLYSWVGFPSVAVEYERDERFAGSTKWNYWKLWNFALDGVTSFSTIPLKLASYIGLGVAVSGFCYAGWILYRTLRFGDPVAGWPTLMIVILCIGGIQLLALGIIGEYLARMFDEIKQRPLYLIQSRHLSDLANVTP